MKKYLPVMVASGILLVTFQNCSQSASTKVAGSDGLLPQTKVEDPTLSQAKSLDILVQDNQKISLNLQTGELVQDNQGQLALKCLSESMHGQIKDLLANSSLCEFQKPGPDVACGQIYSAPYSEIHWATKSVKVGEAVSSCQKDVDLCGQDGQILRGLLRDVISRWSEWSCDFKIVIK